MAGLTQKQPMWIRRTGNVYFTGDGETEVANGHPPMMAEIILDLTLGIPIPKI